MEITLKPNLILGLLRNLIQEKKKDFFFLKNVTKEVFQLLFELSSLMKISKNSGYFMSLDFWIINNDY